MKYFIIKYIHKNHFAHSSSTCVLWDLISGFQMYKLWKDYLWYPCIFVQQYWFYFYLNYNFPKMNHFQHSIWIRNKGTLKLLTNVIHIFKCSSWQHWTLKAFSVMEGKCICDLNCCRICGKESTLPSSLHSTALTLRPAFCEKTLLDWCFPEYFCYRLQSSMLLNKHCPFIFIFFFADFIG